MSVLCICVCVREREILHMIVLNKEHLLCEKVKVKIEAFVSFSVCCPVRATRHLFFLSARPSFTFADCGRVLGEGVFL